MERRTFLKAGLSAAAAATMPDLNLRASIPRALASEALKATTIAWWGWGDPPLNPNLTAGPGMSHNSRNDAVKVLYEKSHPSVISPSSPIPTSVGPLAPNTSSPTPGGAVRRRPLRGTRDRPHIRANTVK